MRRAVAALVLSLSSHAGALAEAPLADFEVARTDGWSRALALCDVSSFLLTEPDLDAHAILVRDGRGGWLVPLYGPRFLPPKVLYNAELRGALYRLEKAGEVSAADVASARRDIAKRMLPRFRRFRASERLFLEDQARVCDRLVAVVLREHPRREAAPADGAP